MDESILDLMSHGAGAMWVVLGFSVLAMAVGIERVIAQWKFVTRARALGDTVTRCLAKGALQEGRSACERSPSPIADVFLVGYEKLGRSKPEHVATADWTEIPAVKAVGRRRDHKKLGRFECPASLPTGQRTAIDIIVCCDGGDATSDKNGSPNAAHAISANGCDRFEQIARRRQVSTRGGQISDLRRQRQEREVTAAQRPAFNLIKTDGHA